VYLRRRRELHCRTLFRKERISHGQIWQLVEEKAIADPVSSHWGCTRYFGFASPTKGSCWPSLSRQVVSQNNLLVHSTRAGLFEGTEKWLKIWCWGQILLSTPLSGSQPNASHVQSSSKGQNANSIHLGVFRTFILESLWDLHWLVALIGMKIACHYRFG